MGGANVKICINGTVPSSVQEPVAGQGLKNSAHGQIVVLGIPVPVPVPFCEVTLNACTGSSPACSELKPGAPVQLCSSLSVPTATPDTDVDVTWKVLRESRVDDQCETTSDINALKDKGKTTMACLSIPAGCKRERELERGEKTLTNTSSTHKF